MQNIERIENDKIESMVGSKGNFTNRLTLWFLNYFDFGIVFVAPVYIFWSLGSKFCGTSLARRNNILCFGSITVVCLLIAVYLGIRVLGQIITRRIKTGNLYRDIFIEKFITLSVASVFFFIFMVIIFPIFFIATAVFSY